MRDTDGSTPTSAELLAEQERSGLSIAAFARRRGIAPWKIYAARRRAQMERRGTGDRFAAVTVVDSRPLAPSFELELPGRGRLLIPPGFDAAELARVVAALSGC